MGEGDKPNDQAFFLALAQNGREAWNKWRATDLNLPVTFEDIDFSKLDNSVDFSGFIFGDSAEFQSCIFPDSTNFSGATFGYNANFCDATFNSTSFMMARFGRESNFSNTVFSGYETEFYGAAFGVGINFTGATFTNADFRGAIIPYADFSRAIFNGEASFDVVSRNVLAEVASLSSGSWPEPLRSMFLDGRRQLDGLERFDGVSFADAHFKGPASFTGRVFARPQPKPCDFTGALFDQPPNVDSCEGIERVDFYGAKVRFSGQLGKTAAHVGRGRPQVHTPGWTKDSKVAVRLRTFRKLAEDAKNHDLERDLYIEERKAERGILLARYFRRARDPRVWPRLFNHSLWILVMGLYWLLADYGRSFIRPFFALVASVFLFYAAYLKTLPLPNMTDEPGFRSAVAAFTIASAVPFVGTLTVEKEVKATLFCGNRATDQAIAQARNVPVCVPTPTLSFQLLVLAQSILSTLLFFFIALALRNYFKLR